MRLFLRCLAIVFISIFLSAVSRGQDPIPAEAPAPAPAEAPAEIKTPFEPTPSPMPTLPTLPSMGHNLTVTADMLEPHQCTLGFLVTACGLTPKLSFGISPWMFKDYGLANAGFRWEIFEPTNTVKWMLQGLAFKTAGGPREPYCSDDEAPPDWSWNPPKTASYQMESYWLILARTETFTPAFRVHTNLQLQYYVDETMPMSLRRPSWTKSPFGLNFSSLYEVAIYKTWVLMGELGGLDLTRDPVRLHTGVSIGQSRKRLTWHIGYSITSTLRALFDPSGRRDVQQSLFSGSWRGYNQDLGYYDISEDYAIHPEFSVQYFF